VADLLKRRMIDGDDRGLRHFRVLADRQFDLDWIDIVAAGFEHLFQAAGEHDVSVRTLVPKIAGANRNAVIACSGSRPLLIEECKAKPKESFWQKVKAEAKKLKKDVTLKQKLS